MHTQIFVLSAHLVPSVNIHIVNVQIMDISMETIASIVQMIQTECIQIVYAMVAVFSAKINASRVRMTGMWSQWNYFKNSIFFCSKNNFKASSSSVFTRVFFLSRALGYKLKITYDFTCSLSFICCYQNIFHVLNDKVLNIKGVLYNLNKLWKWASK